MLADGGVSFTFCYVVSVVKRLARALLAAHDFDEESDGSA